MAIPDDDKMHTFIKKGESMGICLCLVLFKRGSLLQETCKIQQYRVGWNSKLEPTAAVHFVETAVPCVWSSPNHIY